MADLTTLHNNAIVRNASVGTPLSHGPMKSGELPLVQVKQPPGGPQIKEGQQQKAVTILPPRDAASAVRTGGLPMVKVKMTDGKPKADNGMGDSKVIIRDSKQNGVSAGGLPMIQVKMDNGKPQVQTLPNVAGGPPQIPASPPVLSAPRVAPVNQGYVTTPSQGYVAAPALGRGYRVAVPAASQARVMRVAAPQLVVALPPVPELTTDQLMLFRHLTDKYLAELITVETSSDPTADPTAAPVVSEVMQFTSATLAAIDEILIATAVRAEAAAIAAAEQAAVVAVVPVARTIAAAASASISPTPSVAYSAGRVGGRSYSMPGARTQRNSAMAPRRTPRSASPLPPVIVKMDGRNAVVQNKAEIAAAKAVLDAPAVEEMTYEEALSSTEDAPQV